MDEEMTSSDELQDASQTLSDQELFDKNMATFLELMPHVYGKIINHKPISKLVYLDNGEPTVDFNGTNVYERGAITEAKEQLEKYAIHADRLKIDGMGPDSLDPHASPAFSSMWQRFTDSGFKIAQTPMTDESYFLIMVGVGLAQHLDAVVERTKCRVLVLIEPNADLMYQSCYVYDWRPLIERMNERGAIEIEIGSHVTNLVANLNAMFRQYNPAGLDGTTLYRHYQTSITGEIERAFKAKISTALMGLGFFQDEVNMIGQTYKNLEHGKSRLVEVQSEQPGIPCMIVGNGPSLDDLLPIIRENAENAVIFACGSAITTLVENGIMPDFWVMSERVREVLTMVEDAAEIFDTRAVTFIGSTTVFPGVIDYFDDYILFLRPGLSTAPIFRTRDDQVLIIPDPVAANSGLSVALHLGFREFYLMGVDAGSKFKDRGHAKGGFYERVGDYLKELPLSGPANFGGTIWTTSILKWSRENLEKLMGPATGRTFYNLSDGALIKYAKPLHHKAAKFDTPKQPKKEIVEKLTKNCAIYTKEEFDEKWDEAAIIDRLPGYCEEIKSAIIDDDMDDFLYAKRLAELLESEKAASGMAMFVRGTLFSFLIAFEFLNNRFIDPDEREAGKKIFKEEFAELVDSMSSRANEVFLGLEDGEPWDGFVK